MLKQRVRRILVRTIFINGRYVLIFTFYHIKKLLLLKIFELARYTKNHTISLLSQLLKTD